MREGDPVDPFINRTLPGGYTVLELVGIGGMGRVYRAEQTALRRTVAVKVIHPHLLSDESTSARFITEARAASQLNHPNSVGVIDFGKTNDGQLYLVMEFLRGKDLARVAYDDGPLPFDRIVDVLRQACAALAEAHHLGIVHRDLKPENIVLEPMRSGGDFVKVVDFGLAKMREGPKQSAITAAGIICGTPDYMAPEQGRAGAVDARTDIYAMGVILFQLLTGKLPFVADNPTQVVLMHLSIAPPDPRQVAPERKIPEALVDVVNRAMAKDPDQRFQSAVDFAQALVNANKGHIGAGDQPVPSSALVKCATCLRLVPRNQKFCGECGARLSIPPGVSVAPPSLEGTRPTPSAKPGMATDPQLPLVLANRADDLAWLEGRHADARASVAAARIVGEPGVGKTRLIREFIAFGPARGDLVVETGPDPFWADVSHFAVRRAIAALADLAPDGGGERSWTGANAEARCGLLEIFDQADHHPGGLSPAERRYTMAEALRWAISEAARRAKGNRVILVVDDLNRVDGSSRNAFADVMAEPPLVPLLLIAAHTPGFDPHLTGNDTFRQIMPLPRSTANQLARGYTLGERNSDPSGTSPSGVLPLYVEQLVRFSMEGGTEPPSRLADLVALRIERLSPAARRTLQAAAVLGDDVDPTDLGALIPIAKRSPPQTERNVLSAVLANVSALTAAQIIERTPSGLRHAHPLVREIVIAMIPAEVRRDLHRRVARLAETKKLPVEVRAWHLLNAEDSFEALLLVESVSERALARGDAEGAVLWLKRGLELARRELVRGELDDPLQAVLIFSRKLGEALAAAGALVDADGILREALDLAGPSGRDRARVLGVLANVAHGRDRSGDALRYLTEAIEQAAKSGEHELAQSLEGVLRGWAS
jgi:serine/threonine-protein kinase